MDNFIDQLTNPISAVGHLNYILVILSVSMSKMRWLRIFGIASGLTGVIYYGFLVSDGISATWEFIFTMVNAIQLAIMLMAGRRKSMDEDEKLFVETVMPVLDGNLRTRMLKLARWETRQPDEILVEEGQAAPQLVFIARGAASVEKAGTIVGVCGPGDFLGEMSFLTGRPHRRPFVSPTRSAAAPMRLPRSRRSRRRIRPSGRRWNSASTATSSAS